MRALVSGVYTLRTLLKHTTYLTYEGVHRSCSDPCDGRCCSCPPCELTIFTGRSTVLVALRRGL